VVIKDTADVHTAGVDFWSVLRLVRQYP